jgi:hypothetical protein
VIIADEGGSHELIGVVKGVVQVCLERKLEFDCRGIIPSPCKQASYCSKCALQKKAAVKEYEESKTDRIINPWRYQMAAIALMELPDQSRVAYEAAYN